MDNQTYKKTMKLIVIGNVLYFLLSNIKTVLYLLSSLSPILLGACIAFVLNIPMRFFERRISKKIKKAGFARAIAIVLSIVVFFTVIILIISLIIPEITQSVFDLTNNLPAIVENFSYNLTKFFAKYGIDLQAIFDKLSFEKIDLNAINYKTILGGISIQKTQGRLISLFSVTAGMFSKIVKFFLSIVFAIYILSSKEILAKKSKILVCKAIDETWSGKILDFGQLVYKSFENFIAGQGTEAVILGMMFLVSMSILGIPNALSSAAVIGFFSLIPIFGAFVGFIFSLFTILAVSPVKAVWFAVLFLILQQIEGNLVYPRVVGKSIGLPGMWVIFAVTVGGTLAGINGIIFGVPTMSIIYTLVNEYIEKP